MFQYVSMNITNNNILKYRYMYTYTYITYITYTYIITYFLYLVSL